MTRYLSFWAMLLLLPLTNSCYAQVADSAALVGSLSRCWRAFSHEYAIIYGLEETEIKQFSKKRICFTSDSVGTFYGTVYAPTYSFKKVNAENYSRENFDCSKKKVNIYVDSVYEITMKTTAKGFQPGTTRKMTDVMLFDGECLYMVVDGVYFKMVDADSKVAPTTSN
jgi:hypothetical protein